ncbi:bifunctional helix-turn-helix transcriptional regulator/GNAT family N-acetyltransferase [bacterium]|nr:bifunctional helix-turn-helix transcriptional regulator/GNAT family N-acetyltransferase [bacterium]
MDLTKSLGELALGSRFKRISDRLMQDVNLIYKEQHFDFESRWFLIFYALIQQSPQSITELADTLGFSHPAIIQLSKEMEKAGLIKSIQDKKDKRRRLLALTEKGHDMSSDLQKTWEDIEKAAREAIQETRIDILNMFDNIETVLQRKSLFQRVEEKIKERKMDAVKIVLYSVQYKSVFKSLNYEWLKKYFKIEDLDKKILSRPESILKSGGQIFIALHDGKAVGTCAMILHQPREYELAKMAVTEKVQGLQIGKKLAVTAIEWAKKQKARAIVLETNRKLIAACALYKKLGFVETPFTSPSPYRRTTIAMRLAL